MAQQEDQDHKDQDGAKKDSGKVERPSWWQDDFEDDNSQLKFFGPAGGSAPRQGNQSGQGDRRSQHSGHNQGGRGQSGYSNRGYQNRDNRGGQSRDGQRSPSRDNRGYQNRDNQGVPPREGQRGPSRDNRSYQGRDSQGGHSRDNRQFRSRGDRPQGNRPHGDRPQGDRPQGDRPQGDRPQGDRPQRFRPQGDRPQGNRPHGDRSRGHSDNRSRGYSDNRSNRDDKRSPAQQKFNPNARGGSPRAGTEGRANQDQRQETPAPRRAGTTLIKALIELQYSSRALALQAINEQRVLVNEELATKPNHWVYVDTDVIAVDGAPLLRKTIKPVTIVYHKPHKLCGSKEEYRNSLYSALSSKKGWFIPSGVLRKAASGIVIVSNDPRHKTMDLSTICKLTRDVWVKVQRLPKKTELTKLKTALTTMVPDDESVLEVTIGQKNSVSAWVKVKIRSVTIHQILVALKELGLEALNVERRRIGPFTVDNLAPGAWYRLMDNDAVALDELAMSGANDEDASLADIYLNMTEKLFKAADSSQDETADDLPDEEYPEDED